MGTLLFLILLFSHSAVGRMIAQCPEGWKDRGGTNQCYLVHTLGRDRSFADARIYCQARGGDLAHIDTVGLRDWLGQLVGASGNVGATEYMWVGAKYVNDTWKWVETGVPVDNLVIPWDSAGTGNCATLTLDSQLHKFSCGQELKFICHRNIEIPMLCDFTNSWEDANNHCYKKSSTANSWHDAEVECAIDGGHLISIEGDMEQQLAHDLAMEERDNVWIGYTEENHPGEFTWVDGTDSNLTYWHEGQPDTSYNGYGAAVVDNDDPRGAWVVEKVTNENHYLCEKPAGSCLPGWKQFEDSCYYFNVEKTDSVVWFDAKETCENVHAKMVVLDSEEEDLFFRTFMPESDSLWIGLYSEPNDNVYWVDGTAMSDNFTHMTDEDKNNAISNSEQLCVYLQEITGEEGERTSAWVPSDCTTPHRYACEARVGDQLLLIPPSNERYCPDGGWEQLGDFCYLFSFSEKSWVAAQKYCKNQHGTADLASILTWAEQDFVFDKEKGTGWVGLNQMDQDKAWVWSDGSTPTIFNWDQWEPNGDDENCVEVIMLNGKWNDAPCTTLLPFTCKMPASNTPIGTLTTTTPVPDTSACGLDWTENPSTGECYRIEVKQMDFEDARLHCQELYYSDGQSRPDLVSIYSVEEQLFINNIVAAHPEAFSSLWIGMTNEPGRNQWLDGTPTAYFNFQDLSPSDSWSTKCIEYQTGTADWSSANCYQKIPFICEKKGRNYVGPQPPPPPEFTCENGWSFWDNHCYYLSSKTTDWFTAESNCKSLDSSLASVTNLDENNFIISTLKGSQMNIWLGLRDDDNGANWHWTDGTLYDWTNWGYEEPNNGYGDEHCGELKYDEDYNRGKWNDMKCSVNNLYICKTSVVTCPPNWAFREGKCYHVSDVEATRNEGEVKCQEVNTKANLVNIHSSDENQFFMEQLKQSSQSCWMGLQYDDTNWTWSDGTPLEYSNWNYGEPNYLTSERCAEMIDYPNGEPNGKWNNLDCMESRAFGCEMYATHTTGCEAGWSTFGDYCYWFSKADVTNHFLSHHEAQKHCWVLDADLASVHSTEENEFLYSYVDWTDDCTVIGFTDINHQMVFKWDDGTPVVYAFLSDLSYENLQPEELCGCIKYYDSGKWYLQDCTTYSSYVCKKPKQVQSLTPVDTGCREGDLYFEDSCYQATRFATTWENAKADCEAVGQQLLVLENQFETAYISAMMGEMDMKAWLGLSGTLQIDGSVTFTWINGAPVDYTYWDKYEPDPQKGSCVMAVGERSGFWEVRSCDDSFEYICEYKRDGYTAPPPPTTRPPSDYCIYGWENKLNKCYMVMQDAAIWGTAEEKCAKFGGHLVSIESEQEKTLILGLSGMADILDKYKTVWIGLLMSEDSGYEWTDGSGLDYLHWAEGQPESNGGRESCVAADRTTLEMSDRVCLTHLPFVCEAPTGGMLPTATQPTKPPLVTCADKPDWYQFGSHCYKFVSSPDQPEEPWWKSHLSCREEGGELASIMSEEENYWIESMIYEMAAKKMWIGGRSKLGTGYVWLDGEPFIYHNWDSGEPNNVDDQEDCILMYTNNQGYWNDQNCGSTAGRICKRQEGVTQPPPATTKVPDGHCPEGWIHTGTKCISFLTEERNFTIARKVCKNLGKNTDLASIHSAGEQAYLTAAMVVVRQHLWIGMQYEEGFFWVDQTPVSYVNWDKGEPNGGAGKEECVEVDPLTGLWNDISCSNTYGAVCMMSQDPSFPDHHTLEKCPSPYSNYLAYNGACYRVFGDPQTWEDAEATCTGEDAHLVSIMTISEDNFVWAAGQHSRLSSLWMGLADMKNAETFVWTDDWPTIYTHWGKDEPTYSQISHRCVIMNVTDGSWYTKQCDKSFTFICKYTNETAPTPDPPITGYCPSDRWKDLGGGYCYLFSNETETWNDANKICIQEESQLASIHSKEEVRLLTYYTQYYTEPSWIGLIENTDESEVWSDGTSLNYVNWQKGEPNSHADECTEVNERSGLWNDVPCEVTRYYICKVPKIQEGTEHPIPPQSTPGNGNGNGNNNSNGMSAGGIVGIVIASLFVIAAVSVVGYSYIRKAPKHSRNSDQHRLSISNVTYNEESSEGAARVDKVAILNVQEGSEA